MPLKIPMRKCYWKLVHLVKSQNTWINSPPKIRPNIYKQNLKLKKQNKKLDIMKQIIDKSEECTYLEMNNNF